MCIGKRFDISTLVSFCNLQAASPKHFCQEIWVGGYWKDEKCAFSEKCVRVKIAVFQENCRVTSQPSAPLKLGESNPKENHSHSFPKLGESNPKEKYSQHFPKLGENNPKENYSRSFPKLTPHPVPSTIPGWQQLQLRGVQSPVLEPARCQQHQRAAKQPKPESTAPRAFLSSSAHVLLGPCRSILYTDSPGDEPATAHLDRFVFPLKELGAEIQIRAE